MTNLVTGDATISDGALTAIGATKVTMRCLAGALRCPAVDHGTAGQHLSARRWRWSYHLGAVGRLGGYGAGVEQRTRATYDSALFVDTTNDRIGIGTTGPGSKLTVSGGNIALDDGWALSWARPTLTGRE